MLTFTGDRARVYLNIFYRTAGYIYVQKWIIPIRRHATKKQSANSD